MWSFVAKILPFFGQRFLHFSIYGILGLVIFGIYQKVFLSHSSNVGKIERQINVYDQSSSREPLFGCAAWRLQNELYWKKPINQPGSK